MKSIIKTHVDPMENDWANQHISKITGRNYVPRRTYYENIENGELYCYISGGIGWPGKGPAGKGAFGAGVVVAVMKSDEEDPKMKILEAFEDRTPAGLVKGCIRAQIKYRSEGDPGLFKMWFADDEKYQSNIDQLNVKLKQKQKRPFLLAPYPDSEQTNSVDIAFNSLYSVLLPDEDGRPRLSLGQNKIMIRYIEQVKEGGIHGNEDQYPAIAALAHVIHALLIYRPWEQPVEPKGGHVLNEDHQYENLAEDQEMGWFDEYDDDDADDSAPIGGNSVDDYR